MAIYREIADGVMRASGIPDIRASIADIVIAYPWRMAAIAAGVIATWGVAVFVTACALLAPVNFFL